MFLHPSVFIQISTMHRRAPLHLLTPLVLSFLERLQLPQMNFQVLQRSLLRLLRTLLRLSLEDAHGTKDLLFLFRSTHSLFHHHQSAQLVRRKFYSQ